MSFFNELKRRNVFKVAVVYAIVAWVLLQVSENLATALNLPDWFHSGTAFVLILGFPIAVVFAWAYELTPEGIKKTKDVPLEQRMHRLSTRKSEYIVIGLLILGVSFMLVDKYLPTNEISDSQPEKPKSIAVLPFVNMSEDPEQDHFGDGIAEELLNELAAVRDLRVVSRTSSFAFKGQNVSISEIASQLGVIYVLEGSVRKSGNQVRITAQLIDATSDSHLWSETYNREISVSNLLEIQEDVAITVLAALHAEILPDERESLRPVGPANLEALDLYYDGMVYLRQISSDPGRTEETFKSAVSRFEASIEMDPYWAPSQTALGSVYHWWIDEDRWELKLQLSKKHILEAIRLDDQYAPAYGSLAYINMVEGDYDAASKVFRRLRSMGQPAHWPYAIYLMDLTRFDEAVDAFRLAVAETPVINNPKVAVSAQSLLRRPI